jgi:hypothetical protein
MPNTGSSAEDALRVLANKFGELNAIMASRDAQREEEMSALTMRIADLLEKSCSHCTTRATVRKQALSQVQTEIEF